MISQRIRRSAAQASLPAQYPTMRAAEIASQSGTDRPQELNRTQNREAPHDHPEADQAPEQPRSPSKLRAGASRGVATTSPDRPLRPATTY